MLSLRSFLLFLLLFVCLSCIQPISGEKERGERRSYRAGVVEFWPAPGGGFDDVDVVLSTNLDQVKYWTDQAKKNGAEIVVFPEDALFNFLFFETRDDILPYLAVVPEKGTPLCNFSSPFSPSFSGSSSSSFEISLSQPQNDMSKVDVLKTLGCIAKQNKIIVVIDIGEVVYCSTRRGEEREEGGCPEDGRLQFNTQVAIDEEGRLIGHYRKYHLFPEDYVVFNRPSLVDDLSYFNTSFGVTFGQFVCFDLFFRTPEWVLAEEYGISNFVFSTYWVNDGSMPPIPSVALQQGFSRAAGTQLLASNIGLGKFDSGSGIYSQGEPLQEKLNPHPDRPDEFLLVADVPIQQQQQQQPQQQPQQQQQQQQKQRQHHHQQQPHQPRQQHGDNESFPSSSTVVKKHVLSGTNFTLQAQNGPTICEVEVVVDDHQSQTNEMYALVAVNGTLFDGLLPTQTCSFFVCVGDVENAPEGWEGCSLFPLSSATLFNEVKLKMKGIQKVGRPIPTAFSSGGELFSYDKGEIGFSEKIGEGGREGEVLISKMSTVVSVVLHSQWIGE